MDELYLSGSPASEDGLDPFGSASTRRPPLPSGSTSGTQSFLIPTSHSIPGDFGGPPTTSTLQTRFPERDDAERGASASSSSPPTRPCHPRLHQRAKSSGADGRPSTVNVSARSSAGSVVEGLDIPVKRPRNRWSDEETAQLVEGCNKWGVGNWTAILGDPNLTFENRSAVDLKDRFRTHFPSAYHQLYPTAKKHVPASKICDSRAEADSGLKLEKKEVKKKRPFSAAEDAALKEGFHQHGAAWTKISKDPILQDRKSIDLRDRFRHAFPEIYAAAGHKPRMMRARTAPILERSSVAAASPGVPGPSTSMLPSAPTYGGSRSAMPYSSGVAISDRRRSTSSTGVIASVGQSARALNQDLRERRASVSASTTRPLGRAPDQALSLSLSDPSRAGGRALPWTEPSTPSLLSFSPQSSSNMILPASPSFPPPPIDSLSDWTRTRFISDELHTLGSAATSSWLPSHYGLPEDSSLSPLAGNSNPMPWPSASDSGVQDFFCTSEDGLTTPAASASVFRFTHSNIAGDLIFSSARGPHLSTLDHLPLAPTDPGVLFPPSFADTSGSSFSADFQSDGGGSSASILRATAKLDLGLEGTDRSPPDHRHTDSTGQVPFGLPPPNVSFAQSGNLIPLDFQPGFMPMPSLSPPPLEYLLSPPPASHGGVTQDDIGMDGSDRKRKRVTSKAGPNEALRWLDLSMFLGPGG